MYGELRDQTTRNISGVHAHEEVMYGCMYHETMEAYNVHDIYIIHVNKCRHSRTSYIFKFRTDSLKGLRTIGVSCMYPISQLLTLVLDGDQI